MSAAETDVPRSDHRTEANLLGNLLALAGNSLVEETIARLRPEHFDHHLHREVFAGIVAVRAPGDPADEFTVGHYLRDAGKLGDGPAYELDALEFSQLTTVAVFPAHIDAYADIVVKLWGDRRLYEQASRLAAAAHAGRQDLIPEQRESQGGRLPLPGRSGMRRHGAGARPGGQHPV